MGGGMTGLQWIVVSASMLVVLAAAGWLLHAGARDRREMAAVRARGAEIIARGPQPRYVDNADTGQTTLISRVGVLRFPTGSVWDPREETR